MIAVVSHAEDPHAEAVLRHLRQLGAPATLIDLSALPDRATLTISYQHARQPQLRYRNGTGDMLDFRDVRTVWWRRPQAPEPASIVDPDVRLFVLNEWHEALNGLWQLLDARWVNDPQRDDVASRKAYQLSVAAQVGLRVPETLVTSDPAEATAFVQAHPKRRVIFKTFSCTHEVWRETRLLRKDELALIDSVRFAPVIFQEYVEADADLRITVVGDDLFAAAIDSRETDYPVDFRMSLGQADVRPVELPDNIDPRPPVVHEPARARIRRHRHAQDALGRVRLPRDQHGRRVPLRRGSDRPADYPCRRAPACGIALNPFYRNRHRFAPGERIGLRRHEVAAADLAIPVDVDVHTHRGGTAYLDRLDDRSVDDRRIAGHGHPDVLYEHSGRCIRVRRVEQLHDHARAGRRLPAPSVVTSTITDKNHLGLVPVPYRRDESSRIGRFSGAR